jgi:hypothetical protein
MGALVAVGGPRLDLAGGGWDAWPLVGVILALWVGRRVLRISWGPPLFVGSLVVALVLPVVVQGHGIVTTAGLVLALTILLRVTRAGGSAKRNDAV